MASSRSSQLSYARIFDGLDAKKGFWLSSGDVVPGYNAPQKYPSVIGGSSAMVARTAVSDPAIDLAPILLIRS